MTSYESRNSEFIGRQPELSVLTTALDDAIAGRGQVVLLAGEPGIGKTRLSLELAAIAEEKGARVLRGWCYEHGGAPAYWPWLQCMRAYVETADSGQLREEMGPGAADILEILPELAVKLDGLEPPAALEPEQARFRLILSVTQFLKNTSKTQPLVLVLDDLHWGDESSILLLEFMTREIAGSSLLVVGAYRDGEPNRRHPLRRALGLLVREGNFQRVPLAGLSPEEVGEFVKAKAGVVVPKNVVHALHRRTEGNPLFVGEVVDSASPEDIALNQEWITAMPEAVRDAILRRLSGLSEVCNRFLQTASVIGREFDLSMVQRMASEIDKAGIPESLNEALAVSIVEPLTPGAERYQFGHILVQQAVYEEIPPIQKAQIHAAVAKDLEELHGSDLDRNAGILAYQFAGAQPVLGTEKLVHYSLIAGERSLEAFAYEQAIVHFNDVLAVKEGMDTDSETAAALFGLGRAQVASLPRHEIGTAHRNLNLAFDYYASMGDMDRVVAIAFEFPVPQLSEHGIRTGRLIERALELVPADSLEAGRLHSFHGGVQGLADGDYQIARESLDRALSIARQKDDAGLETKTLLTSAQIELWNNHFDAALKKSLSAIDLAVVASDTRSEVIARYFASLSALFLNDTVETQRQASAILEPAERLRDRNWLAAAYGSAAWRPAQIGDWKSAREMIQRGFDHMPFDPRLMIQQVGLEAELGEQDQAEAYLEQLEESVLRSVSGSNTPNGMLAYCAPLARYILGGVRRGDAGESSINAVLSSPSATPWFSTFARLGASFLAVMEEDGDEASAQYSALKAYDGVMFIYTAVDRILGLLAGTLGNATDASRHFEDARSLCTRHGYRPELAWTCHDHAAMLVKNGDSSDRKKAESLLDEGLSIATELAMRPLIERIAGLNEKIASGFGIRTAYPGGLTRREVEVLRLISGGKTDREIGEELFISVKTVGTHVGNILNKTATSNRAEAATFAALHGIVTDVATG
ncbi:MAG: AAA family ATPase [Chloroflexi bacterium]|nr:AAA family ATPase [Chloroflexota bacterium]